MNPNLWSQSAIEGFVHSAARGWLTRSQSKAAVLLGFWALRCASCVPDLEFTRPASAPVSSKVNFLTFISDYFAHVIFSNLGFELQVHCRRMGGDESCVVRRHAVRSRMREVGFETRFRNAHYYFCLKPGRQGAGVL